MYSTNIGAQKPEVQAATVVVIEGDLTDDELEKLRILYQSS